MKDKKKFFDNSNKLNKGYSQNVNSIQSQLASILPKVEIMAEYESLYPGATEKLLAIISKEQSHRHKLENDAIAKDLRLKRFGQLCFFLCISIISYCSYVLSSLENMWIPIIFILSSFVTMLFSLKLKTRRPFKHSQKNLHNKN